MFESQRTIADAPAQWRLYVFEGVVMIVLGVLAIAYPVFATLAVDLYLGWLFLISGVLVLVATFAVRHVPGFWWALVTALLAIVVGLALLLRPAAGIMSLTAVLTAFFVVEGAFQTVTAWSYREAALLGLAARQRHRRSRACSSHHLRMAGNRRLDAGLACWRKPADLGVGDRDGGA
jgi:uncharacterized membrane protein HdeD (DUF308 family)